MSRARIELGRAGEDAACSYLKARGYRILDRNVRAGGVELDVVAWRAGTVCFIEVKTRRSTRFGSGAEAVDERKRERLVRGAGAWLRGNRARTRRVRFDVIVCRGEPGGGFAVEHREGAFDASG